MTETPDERAERLARLGLDIADRIPLPGNGIGRVSPGGQAYETGRMIGTADPERELRAGLNPPTAGTEGGLCRAW